VTEVHMGSAKPLFGLHFDVVQGRVAHEQQGRGASTARTVLITSMRPRR
jgi:hypothetical protein